MTECRELIQALQQRLRDGPLDQGAIIDWVQRSIELDCVDGLALLFSQGAAVEQADAVERRPLALAAALGSRRCLLWLLEQGADPYAGRTLPVLMAIGHGHDELALALLQRAPPRHPDEQAQWMREALAKCCLACVECLLAQGYPVNQRADNGMHALEWAAQNADIAVMQCLRQAGADLDLPGTRGMTPLMAAIAMGRNDNAHWLLDQGADPAAPSTAGTPLSMLASRLAKPDQRLLERLCAAQSRMQADAGEHLRAAAQSGQTRALRLLLADSQDVDAVDADGESALHKACRCCSAECAHLLLQHGARIELQNLRGEVPLVLLWAIYPQRMSTLSTLLEHGANPRVCSVDQHYVSQLAAIHGEVELIDALQRQANTHFPLANDPVDWSSHRAVAELCLALRRNDRAKLHTWCDNPPLTPEQLVSASAAGLRQLMFDLVAGGWLTLVQDLLDGGLDVDIADAEGNTPLNIAARHGQTRVAELLLSRGADPQSQAERGFTPRQFAKTDGIADLLRRHGG